MNFLAGILALLLLPTYSFYSASVDVANSTITSSTNYTFSLALSSSYPTIPGGFRIVVVLPSVFSLPYSLNTLPKYCTVIDFTEVVITTLYNPSITDLNGQCGMTGTNTVTLVTPYDIPVLITFKIGLVTNPSIAYNGNNLGNVQFYGYYPNTTNNSYYFSYSFANNVFNPGTLNFLSFSQTNLNVGGWSNYTVSVMNNFAVPSNGVVIFIFSLASYLSTAANTIVTGSLNNTKSGNLGIIISGQTATITGLLLSGASSGTNISITISQVENPKFVGYTNASIYTATSASEYIEKTYMTIASINPCAITFAGFISTSKSVLSNTQLAIYFFNDIYDASALNQFYFQIVFPTSFTIQSTSACVNGGGLSTSPSVTCTKLNNQFTSNLVTQIDQTVLLRFINIINPPNNATTDYIKIYLYTSANVLICQNLQFTTYTATPNAVVLNTKVRKSAYVADPGPYQLSFTISTLLPAGGFIKIVMPTDQYYETSGIQCLISNSTGNICTKLSTSVYPGTTELLMKEWCSAFDKLCSSCCSSGTSLQVAITGIQNPLYYNPEVISNIMIYTYNPNVTGVIDMVTNGGQFVPSLVYRVTYGSLYRFGHVVQVNTNYQFFFVSQTQYIPGAFVIINLPSSLVFPVSSNVVCTNGSVAVGCSYNTNTDGSINTFTLYPCPNGCGLGTFFGFSMTNVRNPNTTGVVLGSSYFTVFYQSYIIESGQFNNSLPSFLTNNISQISIIRSSNKVSALTSLSLSFITSS